MTAKKPTATQIPLVLVRLNPMLGCGSGGAPPWVGAAFCGCHGSA